MVASDLDEIAQRNVRAFTLFRMFFSARFYYPVYALLFLTTVLRSSSSVF